MGRGILRFMEKDIMAQPKRVREMQAGQFQEGDQLQEGPREKSKGQESRLWASKESNLVSNHCHSTQFYRPDTEAGPWPILAHLLFTTRHYCACVKDEETEKQGQYLRGHLRPEKTASGQLTSPVRESKGADSLPRPPHSPMTPERDAATVVPAPEPPDTPQ